MVYSIPVDIYFSEIPKYIYEYRKKNVSFQMTSGNSSNDGDSFTHPL